MTQATPTIGANQSGLSYRTKDNDGKMALLTHHKGNAAPSYAAAGMIWVDDSATPWLLKFYTGTDWITLGETDPTGNTFAPYMGTVMQRMAAYAADTGDADEYAVAPAPAVAALAAGQIITLKPANANTGACTLAVSGLAPVAIKLLSGANPHAAALKTTGMYNLIFDGVNFVLMNPSYSFGSAAFANLVNDPTMASASSSEVTSSAATKTYVDNAVAGTSPHGALLNTTYYTCPTQNVTISVASPGVVTFPGGANRPQNGCPVRLTTTGALPAGLAINTTYYVVNSSGSTCNLSATPGGAAINTTGAGSGTHTISNAPYEKAINNPSYIQATVVGGTGGSSASANQSGGGGGGGAKKKILASALSTSETVTCGAAGTGSTTDGGTSSFGAFCSATGGQSGVGASTGQNAGGSGSGGDINITGGYGGSYNTTSGLKAPGVSAFGLSFGVGGSSSTTGQPGIVIVEEYS